MEPDLICTCFNLTRERSQELINKYAKGGFERYLKGEISNGVFLASFMDLDELTTNERCFLTCHSTQVAMAAKMELVKQIRIAELLGTGGF